jgi:hypothetical protein
VINAAAAEQQSIESSYPYGDACYPFIHSLTFIATLMAGFLTQKKPNRDRI